MRKTSLVIAGATFLVIALPALVFIPRKKSTVFISPLPKSTVAQTATYQSMDKNKNALSPIPTLKMKSMNVFLLGLDARSGDKNPRCDAIHIFTFNALENKITMTSVPRGTTVPLPGIAPESSYLGNSCHIMGIDFAVKEIEKITGIHPDYVVKIGFSQTLGIFRSLNIPTTTSLQFLRNRQYGIGDYQRSHNQALFIKDMFLAHFEQIANLPNIVKYLLFQMVDTDLPFETASQLLDRIKQSGIYKNPDNIKLVAKPISNYQTRDLHFDTNQASSATQLAKDREFQDYQTNLIGNLANLISRGDNLSKTNQQLSAYNLIKTPFSQQLWLQIEDEDIRNNLHFAMLRIYVLSARDKTASSLVLDFITEMENAKEEELSKEAELLLTEINE